MISDGKYSEPFKVGDVVQLKSGGPLGTVSSISGLQINIIYNNPQTGCFERFATHEETLIHAQRMGYND